MEKLPHEILPEILGFLSRDLKLLIPLRAVSRRWKSLISNLPISYEPAEIKPAVFSLSKTVSLFPNISKISCLDPENLQKRFGYTPQHERTPPPIELALCTALEELVLHPLADETEWLKKLEKATRLSSLAVYRSLMDPVPLLTTLSNLQSLVLHYVEAKIFAEIVSHHCSSLRSLVVGLHAPSFPAFTDADVSVLLKCTKLRKLELTTQWSTRRGPDGLLASQFEQLTALPNLTELDICAQLDNISFEILSRFTNLRYIALPASLSIADLPKFCTVLPRLERIGRLSPAFYDAQTLYAYWDDLRTCTILTNLKLQIGVVPDDISVFRRLSHLEVLVDSFEAVDVICSLSASLKELYLSVTDDFPCDSGGGRSEGSAGRGRGRRGRGSGRGGRARGARVRGKTSAEEGEVAQELEPEHEQEEQEETQENSEYFEAEEAPDTQEDSFGKLSQLTNLTYIDLPFQMTDEELSSCVEGWQPRMQSIGLRGNSSQIPILTKCTSLTELELYFSVPLESIDDGLTPLLKICTELSTLRLHCEFTGECFLEKNLYLARLTQLTCEAPFITAAGSRAISALPRLMVLTITGPSTSHCPVHTFSGSLRWLELECATAAHIPDILRNSRLNYLRIDDFDGTHADLPQLSLLPCLREVVLSPLFTERQRRSFATPSGNRLPSADFDLVWVLQRSGIVVTSSKARN